MSTSDKPLNTFALSKSFFDWSFENPDKVKPLHSAIFFFAIDLCNRLGWKKKFGLPTSMVMEATGIRSYNTYKKGFDDLVEWGFFILIEKSKNQHTANIIELSKNDKANDKALNKATSKQTSKHIQSTVQSTDSINILNNIELENERTEEENPLPNFVKDNREKVKQYKKELEERINFTNLDPLEAKRSLTEIIKSSEVKDKLNAYMPFHRLDNSHKGKFVSEFIDNHADTNSWKDLNDLVNHIRRSIPFYTRNNPESIKQTLKR